MVERLKIFLRNFLLFEENVLSLQPERKDGGVVDRGGLENR